MLSPRPNAERPNAAEPTRGLDAIVTHVEVNDRHGVGVLLQTLFGAGEGVVTVRSRDDYDGAQEFGVRAVRVSHRRLRLRLAARLRVASALRGLRVRRVLCVPYYADDVRSALAIRETSGAPLLTWIMDDQNLLEPSIPDRLMAELLERSAVVLAISPELRDAYARKYRREVGFAPPLVPARLLRPAGASDAATGRPMVIGNIWGARWYEDLRRTVRGTGIALDWCSPAGLATFWQGFEPKALASDGIEALGALPESTYVERLRAAPYVVVPSGTLDAADDRPGISRFSLPSRIVFAVAAAHAPVIVLGSLETAAARFVAAHRLGAVVPYDRPAFQAAVAALTAPAAQREVRGRAAALAGAFSAEGAAEWLWRSLEMARPADDRFERLAPRGRPAA
jgi:hypothetical protein